MKSELKGLVLAGGKSARMKEPKAWLKVNDLPQWQWCDGILSTQCDEVYFSVSSQLKIPLLVAEDRLVDDIFKESCGPLGGIISAFYKIPTATFLVLACDMPHFDQHAVEYLVQYRQPNRMATVFINECKDIEPLCGIYEPAIFPHLVHYWSKKIFCPRRILRELDVQCVPAKDLTWLKNMNYPADVVLANTKKITINFYAGMKEKTQCSSLEIVTRSNSVAELYLEIAHQHEFLVDQKSMRFAKNHVFVDGKSPLHDGDTVVFIPPVSGG